MIAEELRRFSEDLLNELRHEADVEGAEAMLAEVFTRRMIEILLDQLRKLIGVLGCVSLRHAQDRRIAHHEGRTLIAWQRTHPFAIALEQSWEMPGVSLGGGHGARILQISQCPDHPCGAVIQRKRGLIWIVGRLEVLDVPRPVSAFVETFVAVADEQLDRLARD